MNEITPPSSRPSNSGIATCVAASSGVSPESDSSQVARDEVAADGLDHRHVERGERRRVPVLPRLADAFARLGGVVAGAAAAGGEHRRDQRVDVPVEQGQRRHASVGVAAQRVAPDGERVGPGVLDRAGQLVDEGRVARQAVRAVEADADRRAGRVEPCERLVDRDVAGAGDVDAEVGDLARRLEAVAVEQERVGQEAQQLLDVVDVAVAQVLAGLGDRAGGGGRQRRHLGVGLGLAAQREQDRALRAAALDEQIQPLGPAAAAAEDATEDDAGAVEHLGDQGGRVGVAAGVGAAHLGEVAGQPLDGGGGREDLGVGGGHEAQHGRTSVSMVGRSDGAPPSISAARRSVSRWLAIRSPSASWRSSRAVAKGVEPGTKRRPRAAATRASSARRKASCSSAPCHDVPSTAPAAQPSASPSSACSSGSPPWRCTRPWRIS